MTTTPEDLRDALPGLFKDNPYVQTNGNTVTVISKFPADTLSYEAALTEATATASAPTRTLTRTVVHNRDTPEEARYLYLAIRVHPFTGPTEFPTLTV